MMDIFQLSKLSLLILLLAKKNTEGCSCFPEHPQTKICSSDFAFVGKVLEEIFVPGPELDPANNFAKYQYKIELITKIKGIDASIGTTLTTETPGNGALCGSRLPVGDTLILSGSFSGQEKVVRLCDLVVNVKDLTRRQKVYFLSGKRSSYVKNCACKNILPYDPKTSPSDGCEYSQEEPFCYFQTALCKQTRRGCRWKNANC